MADEVFLSVFYRYRFWGRGVVSITKDDYTKSTSLTILFRDVLTDEKYVERFYSIVQVV
jgi:hypothetical protein